MSLKDPLYVSVHEHSTHTTPESLQQSYIVCGLEDKMAMLWSFIRNHLKQKIIVFFSSCKQVKYRFVCVSFVCFRRSECERKSIPGQIHVRGVLPTASRCQLVGSLRHASSDETDEHLRVILQEATCRSVRHRYCRTWIG